MAGEKLMAVDKSVTSINQIERKPPVLSRLLDEASVPYRRIALQLHNDLRRGYASRSVMLVSPDDSRMCAVAAANLACCMAEELGRAVLLADATREGLLSSEMTNAAPSGLNDFLSNSDLPLSSLTLPTSFNDVSFLPSGSRSAGYRPENAAELLAAAANEFEFVVVTGGAILTDPSALACAPAFGVVLMLVIENETSTRKYEDAEQALKMCKVENVRLVLVDRIKRPVIEPPVKDEFE
jgi:hypothetical protein